MKNNLWKNLIYGKNSTPDQKRQRLSWLGSIGFHVIVAIILGVTGVLSYTSLAQTDNIIEVSAVGGGGDNGGGGPAAPSEPTEATPTPEELGADAILQHSDTAKTKITYDELEKVEQQQQQEYPTPQVIKPTDNSVTDSNKPNSNSNSHNNTNSNGNNTQGNNNNPNGGDSNGDGNHPGNPGGSGQHNGPGPGDDNSIHSSGDVDVPPKPIYIAKASYEVDDETPHLKALVSLVIDKTGHVESVQIIRPSGDRSFDNIARSAAKKNVYTPAMKDGHPVRVKITHPYTI